MLRYKKERYHPDSGNKACAVRVIWFELNAPSDLLDKKGNIVIETLKKEGLDKCVGVYFYRFLDGSKPFVKIGETARPGGIAKRFKNGWHGKGTDSYLTQTRNNEKVDSEFLKAVKKITDKNRMYFIFCEHPLMWSHTKADEMYSMTMHQRFYKQGTVNGERANKNRLMGRKLVFHKSAFSEALCGTLPNGSCDSEDG